MRYHCFNLFFEILYTKCHGRNTSNSIYTLNKLWKIYQNFQFLNTLSEEYPKNRTLLRKSVIRDEINKVLKVLSPSLKLGDPKNISHVSHVVDTIEVSLNRSEIIRLKNVHNRLVNLKHLVESLTNAKHIDKSLVIFSHDYWDDEINHFIRSISAFKVMQIFFPFSIQLNPFSFPGRDPRDCLWNGTHLKNVTKCLNLNWSDRFGHYRVASLTQIKHHWWWKLVQIFDKIRELQEFRGYVLFLEEDHYVFPDILHILKLLVVESRKLQEPVNVFCLGNYQGQLAKDSTVTYLRKWFVSGFNMGFAFNRDIYKDIKKCAKEFCSYDDYNWDWTLASVVSSCFKKSPPALTLRFSRVLHIGSCGTHVRGKNCDLVKELALVSWKLKRFSKKFFPTKMEVKKYSKFSKRMMMMNGGWRDIRDHSLCLAISNGTSDTETVLNNLQDKNFKFEQIQ
ncbi:Alpha-1,6-mannosyl-glycoprotein 2-beta-N-acetylglucosaminyltransferase, partial [Armadillidium nasatum]